MSIDQWVYPTTPSFPDYDKFKSALISFMHVNGMTPTHLIINRNKFLVWANSFFYANNMDWDRPISINLEGIKLFVILGENVAEDEYFFTWSGKNE